MAELAACVVGVAAITALAYIERLAIKKGLNGRVLAATVGAIAAIAGFAFGVVVP